MGAALAGFGEGRGEVEAGGFLGGVVEGLPFSAPFSPPDCVLPPPAASSAGASAAGSLREQQLPMDQGELKKQMKGEEDKDGKQKGEIGTIGKNSICHKS